MWNVEMYHMSCLPSRSSQSVGPELEQDRKDLRGEERRWDCLQKQLCLTHSCINTFCNATWQLPPSRGGVYLANPWIWASLGPCFAKRMWQKWPCASFGVRFKRPCTLLLSVLNPCQLLWRQVQASLLDDERHMITSPLLSKSTVGQLLNDEWGCPRPARPSGPTCRLWTQVWALLRFSRPGHIRNFQWI